jgi:hypothetical protein
LTTSSAPAPQLRDLPRDFVVGEGGGLVNGPTDSAIWDAARGAGRIVAAWGAWPGPYPQRVRHVMAALEEAGPLEALKLTKHGAPWHPLYVRADAQPVPFTVLP